MNKSSWGSSKTVNFKTLLWKTNPHCTIFQTLAVKFGVRCDISASCDLNSEGTSCQINELNESNLNVALKWKTSRYFNIFQQNRSDRTDPPSTLTLPSITFTTLTTLTSLLPS